MSLLNIVKEGTRRVRRGCGTRASRGGGGLFDTVTVQRSRKITDRCTMKLITVAVPWAITKAAGIAQPL
jgi:hypothetical protein